MKCTIKNLINSPYDVLTLDGPQRVPARGELTADFDERSLAIIRHLGYFQVSEAESVSTEPAPEPQPKRGPGRPKKAD